MKWKHEEIFNEILLKEIRILICDHSHSMRTSVVYAKRVELRAPIHLNDNTVNVPTIGRGEQRQKGIEDEDREQHSSHDVVVASHAMWAELGGYNIPTIGLWSLGQ